MKNEDESLACIFLALAFIVAVYLVWSNLY